MQNTDRYYQESGAISPVGIITVAGASIVAAALLGAVYGYAIYFIPLVYLNFFICLFFGIGVGKVVGMAGFWGKIRNTKLMMGMSLFAGVLAWYFGWLFWLHAFSDFETFMWQPGEVYQMTSLFSMLGIYEIFGWTPTGAALYIIWAIEAIIIIGGAFLNGLGSLGRQPYCESCDDWTKESVVSSRLEPVLSPREMISKLEQHDMSAVTDLKLANDGDMVRTKVNIHKCAGCSSSKYLSVDQIVLSYDDDGKVKEDENTIVENLVLSSSDYASLQDWRKTLGTTEAAEA